MGLKHLVMPKEFTKATGVMSKRQQLVVKNPPVKAEDKGSSPGPGRSHMPQSN